MTTLPAHHLRPSRRRTRNRAQGRWFASTRRRFRRLLVEAPEDRRVLSLSIQLQPSSDSGFSDSDRLTNVTDPAFDVTVDGAGTVGINVDDDGNANASQTVTGVGTYALTSPTLSDGQHNITAIFTPDVGDPVQESLTITIDTQGPQLQQGRYIEPAGWESRSTTKRMPRLSGSCSLRKLHICHNPSC